MLKAVIALLADVSVVLSKPQKRISVPLMS